MTAAELSAARATITLRLLDNRRMPKAIKVHLEAAVDALTEEFERADEEERLELARGPVVYVTTGTRLHWSTLRGWLWAWTAITSRAQTSLRGAQETFHLTELPDEVVEASRDREELSELEAVVRAERSPRFIEVRVRLLNAIDRARNRRLHGPWTLEGEEVCRG